MSRKYAQNGLEGLFNPKPWTIGNGSQLINLTKQSTRVPETIMAFKC